MSAYFVLVATWLSEAAPNNDDAKAPFLGELTLSILCSAFDAPTESEERQNKLNGRATHDPRQKTVAAQALFHHFGETSSLLKVYI